MNDSNTGTGTSASQTTITDTHSDVTLKEFATIYGKISDEGQKIIMRTMIALANNDVAELESIKSTAPAHCLPILDSCIADIQGGAA